MQSDSRQNLVNYVEVLNGGAMDAIGEMQGTTKFLNFFIHDAHCANSSKSTVIWCGQKLHCDFIRLQKFKITEMTTVFSSASKIEYIGPIHLIFPFHSFE